MNCGAKLNPKVKYRRGFRKADGTPYLSRYTTGDPCLNEATATFNPGGGVALHRCTTHLSQR